jgi:hypothetical protein
MAALGAGPRPEGAPVPLLDALEQTVSALDATDRDAALVEYLRALAAELDRAEAIERGAVRLANEILAEQGAESALYERVTALQAQLGRRSALDRLGQRFHNGLIEMTATRRSAPAQTGGERPAGKLHALRGGA